MTPKRHSSGFTLIEALVALVIFSMAAIGIYGWINSNLITLGRISEVAATEYVLNSSMERLKLVDLSTETSGRFNVSGYWVDWQADLIEPWRTGSTAVGTVGLYDLGLFRVSLKYIKDGKQVGGHNYRRVAYKQVREFKLEGDGRE
jgi:general secretion pathway protein I